MAATPTLCKDSVLGAVELGFCLSHFKLRSDVACASPLIRNPSTVALKVVVMLRILYQF